MSMEMAIREAHHARGYSLPPIDPEEDARLAEQAKSFVVTKLPYAGERSSLRFDRRSRRPFRVRLAKDLAGAELSYSDFQNGLHIQSRATAHEMRLLYTPIFAGNDEQLKLVISQQAFDYICASHAGTTRFYNSERVPNGFLLNREALEALANKATEARKKFNQSKQQINLYRHISWNQRHGGYVALRAAIAYKAWRLAKDAHTIAIDLGMNHCAVRQILNRLCKVARRLGLQTFPRHHSAFADRVIRPYDFNKHEPKLTVYRVAPDRISSAIMLGAG
jgi:hypothetical protein